MSYLDQMNRAETLKHRRRVSVILGGFGALQGAQYAFRPDFPAGVYVALSWGLAGWIVFGVLLSTAGLVVLLLDTNWPGHALATFCYLVLALGQVLSPPHGLPFLVGCLAALHFNLLLAVRGVWARLGIGRVGRPRRANRGD